MSDDLSEQFAFLLFEFSECSQCASFNHSSDSDTLRVRV